MFNSVMKWAKTQYIQVYVTSKRVMVYIELKVYPCISNLEISTSNTAHSKKFKITKKDRHDGLKLDQTNN